LQVLIQECGESRFITVGIVREGWDPLKIPDGTKGKSVGYGIHKGKMFDKKNPKHGRYVKGMSSHFIIQLYFLA
jgi:hypothetical protein